MKTKIDVLDFPRAKVGWEYLGILTKHIGKGGLDIEFLYLFKLSELVITDDRIVESLKLLNIPYTLIPPSSAIRFIKDMVEEGEDHDT